MLFYSDFVVVVLCFVCERAWQMFKSRSIKQKERTEQNTFILLCIENNQQQVEAEEFHCLFFAVLLLFASPLVF